MVMDEPAHFNEYFEYVTNSYQYRKQCEKAILLAKECISDIGALNFGHLVKANILQVRRSRTGIVIPFANVVHGTEVYGIKTF